MAKPLICLDTSVLIEYFRKENKSKTFFFKLAKDYRFAISVLTKFEILVGSNEQQSEFWDNYSGNLKLSLLTRKRSKSLAKLLKN